MTIVYSISSLNQPETTMVRYELTRREIFFEVLVPGLLFVAFIGALMLI